MHMTHVAVFFAAGVKVDDDSAEANTMYQEERARGFGADEDLLGSDLAINDTYLWQDKYRPRKPRHAFVNQCMMRSYVFSRSLVSASVYVCDRSCSVSLISIARYFNRVKTGYDWNKYNQTHYDHDNPPPKSVQGYKFNIFYPDLVDRSVTPV